jgi:hypothetical protein
MAPGVPHVLYMAIIFSFEQFPHEKIFISKNHANIFIFRLFSYFSFIFKRLPSGLQIEDLNISTETGLLGVNSNTLAAKKTHRRLSMKVAGWRGFRHKQRGQVCS